MTKNERLLLNTLRYLRDKVGVGDRGEDRIMATLIAVGKCPHRFEPVSFAGYDVRKPRAGGAHRCVHCGKPRKSSKK